VNFYNLGLVVVDEQHKFGVEQRASLVSKNEITDVMVMTATPIPRTLSMSIFGEIDISTIKDMPFGPKKIKTLILSPSKRKDLYNFLREKLSNGKKIFFVYPLVEDSDSLNLRSATKMYENLSEEFSDFSLELIHGKMKDEEKMEATRKFKDGECDILVATTVIEVGIDISDADIIIIEHAERFGLSQLHQLRGRVGRKGQESYCILLPTEKPTRSLAFFKNNLDGFKIADYDLKVRGPGEFMGVRQHGFKQFKMVDLTEDLNIIRVSKKDAYDLLKKDPELSEHIKLKEEFEKKYGKALFYAKIG
jgi:ATP-dependent DNA helicase RecG